MDFLASIQILATSGERGGAWNAVLEFFADCLEWLFGVDVYQRQAAEMAELYRRELQRHSHAERLRGATLVGPHRDDINILINGDAARDFASQGQQRTLALSLKLSELELAYAEKGEYPVLLLDDALSELDDQRGRRILELPAKTQTFISAATLPSAINQGTKWLVQAIDGVAHLQ